ncbi:hypothetical protein [Actinoplanes italicus]|uniref:hypothetical protein n=1 Tax=Actinoplanes italicus TaxID=113567 RepID=UPI000D04A664|nr:hypothetical protein [Actinoplanes italicus]
MDDVLQPGGAVLAADVADLPIHGPSSPSPTAAWYPGLPGATPIDSSQDAHHTRCGRSTASASTTAAPGSATSTSAPPAGPA